MKHHTCFLVFVLVLGLGACQNQTKDFSADVETARPLYSVAWGDSYNRVALVGSLSEHPSINGGTGTWILAHEDLAVKINGETLVSRETPCDVSSMNQGIGLCDDALYYPSADKVLRVDSGTAPVSAAPGLMGRLLYLMDNQGTLHVMDSGIGSLASDDGILLLYSDRNSGMAVVSGNGSRVFAEFLLPGVPMAHVVQDQRVYIAWYNRYTQEMGVAILDLLDMADIEMGVAMVVAAPPTSIALDHSALVAVTFDGGRAAPLLVDPALGVIENIPATFFTTMPDKVFSFPNKEGLYFWNSESSTLTRFDTLSGKIITTQIL
ncbi:hypothetical protein KKF84_05825 [Myxococcota bacterium]|nr:hypothetical protein [Myxococcota bacterium]